MKPVKGIQYAYISNARIAERFMAAILIGFVALIGTAAVMVTRNMTEIINAITVIQ